MAVLKDLKPEKVFGYFEEICGIPHGSGNTDALSDHLVKFAADRGLEHYQDDLGNVIIIKEATSGYEDTDAVILQGHMDMVCDKVEGCSKDMSAEGLDIAIDGDNIYARETTLGGDDGIAVAMMMALLDDDSLKHPRIETVFTVEEETGLYGAEGIDVSPLTGKRFINLDSEDEGIATVSCAGGVTAIADIPFKREPFEGDIYRLELSGFLGGHSGTEINKGQGNALKTLGRLLFEIGEKTGCRLISAEGGAADNAIPVRAKALVAVKDGKVLMDVCEEYRSIFSHEYNMDPDFKLDVAEADASGLSEDALPFDEVSTQRVVAFLYTCPNGIEKMTPGLEGLPRTSLNLGTLATGEGSCTFVFCIRSSVDSERDMLSGRLECLAKALGGQYRTEGAFPGWEYAQESPLRDLVCRKYKEQTGKDMIVEAIHAGLECGFFAQKIPGLDCVSIGPDVRDVHTPNETLSISSAKRTWELLIGILEG